MGGLSSSLSGLLLKRDETETPYEHVAGDVGGGQTAPASAVRSPVVDHGVRWGLRDDASVRGHQHVVHIELDRSSRPHTLVRVEAFLGCEGRLRRGPLLPGQARPGGPPERAGILSFNLRGVDLGLGVVHKHEARADLAGDGYAVSRGSA